MGKLAGELLGGAQRLAYFDYVGERASQSPNGFPGEKGGQRRS